MSPRTRRVVPPAIEPILVVAGSPPLHDPRWIYKPKFNGFRGVLHLCRGECYIRSKRSNVLKGFAELARRVQAELDVKNAILDGEGDRAVQGDVCDGSPSDAGRRRPSLTLDGGEGAGPR